MIRTFTLRYSDELKARLIPFVKERGGTMNGLILSILCDWLRQNEPHDTDQPT